MGEAVTVVGEAEREGPGPDGVLDGGDGSVKMPGCLRGVIRLLTASKAALLREMLSTKSFSRRRLPSSVRGAGATAGATGLELLVGLRVLMGLE